MLRLQGVEVKKVHELKFIDLTVQSNRKFVKEVKKGVQAGCVGGEKFQDGSVIKE